MWILNDFANRNSTLVATESNWFESPEKSFSESVVDFFRWKLNEVLTEDDIENWVFYTNEEWKSKNEINSNLRIPREIIYTSWKHCDIKKRNNASENIKYKILEKIKRIWYIPSVDKKYFGIFIEWENPEISKEDIKEAILVHIRKQCKNIFKKVNSPLKGRLISWESIQIRDYKDIDHDLLDRDKRILAYWLKNWFLSMQETEKIIDILNKCWDDLEYFYKYNYTEDLIEDYLRNILN